MDAHAPSRYASGPNLPVLAGQRRVIAVELQGHGRTADIDRPLRYELMADDIAALVAQLHIAQVDIMGYSLGGGVALQTAIRHPGIVRRLVLVSRQMKSLGFFSEVVAAFEQMGLDGSRRPPSRLAILPGTTHYDILGTDAVARIAVASLDQRTLNAR